MPMSERLAVDSHARRHLVHRATGASRPLHDVLIQPDLADAQHRGRGREVLAGGQLENTLTAQTAEHLADLPRPHQSLRHIGTLVPRPLVA